MKTIIVVAGIVVALYLWRKLRLAQARHAAAVNVLLAKYTFPRLSDSDKQEVLDTTLHIIERSGGGPALAGAVERYGSSLKFDNEAVEYGWYALSMAELHIPPALPDIHAWNFVKNPYFAIAPTDKMIKHVSKYLKNKYSIEISISERDRFVESLLKDVRPMKDTRTKSVSKGIVGAVLAVIVFVAVWLLLSALYGLVGIMRDEGELWKIIVKDVLAPGLAAYLAFEVVDRVLHSVHWRIAFVLFVATIALLATVNLIFTSEFYLSQDRVSDWHIALITTSLSAVSAIIGAFVFFRKMNSNPASEYEHPHQDGGPEPRSWRNETVQSVDGIDGEDDELTKEFHRKMDEKG